MTREWFDAQLGMLLVLRNIPDDTSGYFAALADIPESVFRRAVSHALRTRTWFPTPAELRRDCDVVAPRVDAADAWEPPDIDPDDANRVEIKNPLPDGKSIFLTVTKDWQHECEVCKDTGWSVIFCDGRSRPRQCGRSTFKCHYGHEYAVKCACFATNQTIQRRRGAQQKYAQDVA